MKFDESKEPTSKKKYSEMTIDDIILEKVTDEDITYVEEKIKRTLEILKDM